MTMMYFLEVIASLVVTMLVTQSHLSSNLSSYHVTLNTICYILNNLTVHSQYILSTSLYILSTFSVLLSKFSIHSKLYVMVIFNLYHALPYNTNQYHPI